VCIYVHKPGKKSGEVGKGLGKLKGWEGSNFFFEDFTSVKITRGREKFQKEKNHFLAQKFFF
jgi:hypothetical protein